MASDVRTFRHYQFFVEVGTLSRMTFLGGRRNTKSILGEHIDTGPVCVQEI